MDIVKVKEIARQYDSELTADDPRFQRSTTLVYRDGSIMQYRQGFLMRCHEWIVCFSEHLGVHISEAGDLLMYWESKHLNVPLEELD